MAQLKYYGTEKEEFVETYGKHLTSAEARIVFDKLLRHFKLKGRLEFTNRISGGNCSRLGTVRLRWKTDFGTLCHEVAHLHEYNKFGKSRHAKRHRRIMARITRYCQKKSWWANEVAARLAPKPIKIITKEEDRGTRILQRRQQIIRYEKRLAYFAKLYKNKISKARRSLAMLKNNSGVTNFGTEKFK